MNNYKISLLKWQIAFSFLSFMFAFNTLSGRYYRNNNRKNDLLNDIVVAKIDDNVDIVRVKVHKDENPYLLHYRYKSLLTNNVISDSSECTLWNDENVKHSIYDIFDNPGEYENIYFGKYAKNDENANDIEIICQLSDVLTPNEIELLFSDNISDIDRTKGLNKIKTYIERGKLDEMCKRKTNIQVRG